MSHTRKKVVGEAKVDAKKEIQIPLDYSFKTITSFEGIYSAHLSVAAASI